MILLVSHRVPLSQQKSDCVAFMLALLNVLTLLSTRAPSIPVVTAVSRHLELVVRVSFLVKRPRLDMLASRALWLTCTSLEVLAETSEPYPALRCGLTLLFAFAGDLLWCLRLLPEWFVFVTCLDLPGTG